MTPTNEQIIKEAERRARATSIERRYTLQDYIIEVMREGWTPPEPVDQDLLAYREWRASGLMNRDLFKQSIMDGAYDNSEKAEAYLAGARMATERERARAEVLVEYIRNHWPKGGSPVLAKYRGEA